MVKVGGHAFCKIHAVLFPIPSIVPRGRIEASTPQTVSAVSRCLGVIVKLRPLARVAVAVESKEWLDIFMTVHCGYILRMWGRGMSSVQE
jgi:hypothetical protein